MKSRMGQRCHRRELLEERALCILLARSYMLGPYEIIISEFYVALVREVQPVCLSVCVCYPALF